MANNFAAFFETLVAGADEYNKAKVGRTALLNSVYKDVKPEAARIGKTVDVYFPDIGPLQAINNGILTGTSVTPNYIPLVFQTRAGAALQFQDFEQWQTAVDLAQKFFDPLYKRAREYLNGQIAALVTTANFNANAPIIGALQGEVGVADQLNAWGTLADQKVPLEDSEKLSLLVHNRVYQKMLGDAGWVQESLVSASIAAAARESADLAHAFNFQPKWDQQMPTASGSILYGQVTLTYNGSTTVTGLNTNFTTAGTGGVPLTGFYLVFGNDPTKTLYKVSSVQSDTSLTLSAVFSTTVLASGSVTTTARFITVIGATVTTTAGSTTVTAASSAFTPPASASGCPSPRPATSPRGRTSTRSPATPRQRSSCWQPRSRPPTWSPPVPPPSRATPTSPCTSTRSPWPCGRSPPRTRPATSSTSATSTSWASPCG